MLKHYYDFSTWLKKHLPYKVQKIAINAGFTCPNRDGKTGIGGCTYCNNQSFNPSYLNVHNNITKQIEDGKNFFSKKYPSMKYLAYFQAYTNTYSSMEHLKSMYEEALSAQDIVGLVIGTRPDCMNNNLLDYFEKLSRNTFLLIEYGVESINDRVLRYINRGHDFRCSQNTIEKTKERGINVGAHIIIGLPGETPQNSIKQASIISNLPIDILKIHQLQILKGTILAKQYIENPFYLYSVSEYIKTISEYIRFLRPDLALERFVSQSPSDMLIAPKWGLKNYQFTNLLDNYLNKNNIYQGDKL